MSALHADLSNLFLTAGSKDSKGELDPTVSKIVWFCQLNDIERFQIRNLWTLRSPKPSDLFVHWKKIKQTSDDNSDKKLNEDFEEVQTPGKCTAICAAWGKLPNWATIPNGGTSAEKERVRTRKKAVAQYLNKYKKVKIGYLSIKGEDGKYPRHPQSFWGFSQQVMKNVEFKVNQIPDPDSYDNPTSGSSNQSKKKKLQPKTPKKPNTVIKKTKKPKPKTKIKKSTIKKFKKKH